MGNPLHSVPSCTHIDLSALRKHFPLVPKSKQPENPDKNKGGRPRKEVELHKGDKAAARFAASMAHVLKAGPHPSEKL
jgi:hypothetical protein